MNTAEAQLMCCASPPNGLINFYFAPTPSQPNNARLNEVIIFTGDITHGKIAGRYITSHHMVMAVKHGPIREQQFATVVHVVIK